jgi:hypothetical protein
MDAATATPSSPLDEGGPFLVRGPDGDDLELVVVACRAPGCICTEALVSISRQVEDRSAPIARGPTSRSRPVR